VDATGVVRLLLSTQGTDKHRLQLQPCQALPAIQCMKPYSDKEAPKHLIQPARLLYNKTTIALYNKTTTAVVMQSMTVCIATHAKL
jgi:hypothetical protein